MQSLQEELNDALSARKEIENRISDLNEILKAEELNDALSARKEIENRISDLNEILKAEELNDALSARKEIENRISDLNEILKANNVGMHDELVDKEGFPRNDINVYEVRLARAKLIKEQNDYKLAMKKCEDILVKFHSLNLPEFTDITERPSLVVQSHKKIAVVGKVETGSPSEYAGLKEGDVILEFGKITGGNMRNINDISEEVKRNVNLYIKVVVKRDGKYKRFNLKPKSWSGRGYLGCVLNP